MYFQCGKYKRNIFSPEKKRNLDEYNRERIDNFYKIEEKEVLLHLCSVANLTCDYLTKSSGGKKLFDLYEAVQVLEKQRDKEQNVNY